MTLVQDSGVRSMAPITALLNAMPSSVEVLKLGTEAAASCRQLDHQGTLQEMLLVRHGPLVETIGTIHASLLQDTCRSMTNEV